MRIITRKLIDEEIELNLDEIEYVEINNLGYPIGWHLTIKEKSKDYKNPILHLYFEELIKILPSIKDRVTELILEYDGDSEEELIIKNLLGDLEFERWRT